MTSFFEYIHNFISAFFVLYFDLCQTRTEERIEYINENKMYGFGMQINRQTKIDRSKKLKERDRYRNILMSKNE